MSAAPPQVFERAFQNQLSDLGAATEQALDFVRQHGVGGEPAYALHLAIEEMATNILKYGYDDQAAHTIRLRIEMEPAAVVVLLEDDGHEFDPLAAPRPDLSLDVEERVPGGLGINLVREFAEELRYERVAGRNRLIIRIRR